MSDEKWLRLTRLVRVRVQRRQACERERVQRGKACASAEEALQRQEAMLHAGIARLDEGERRVCASVEREAWTGAEMVCHLAHLARGRAAVATERAAVAAASTVCDVLRADERRAGAALVKATQAEQKAQTLHAEAQGQRRRARRIEAELLDDELNSARAALRASRGSR